MNVFWSAKVQGFAEVGSRMVLVGSVGCLKVCPLVDGLDVHFVTIKGHFIRNRD